ncbi:MAG: hypothetical protein Q4E35_06160 [Eubacteriales bacterium]|nr:hypothetical protein [Eubacteriales bacterium]
MKFLRVSAIKKAKKLRQKRDKGFFTVGLLIGAAVTGAAAKLLGRHKCKSCVKRMLAEKK